MVLSINGYSHLLRLIKQHNLFINDVIMCLYLNDLYTGGSIFIKS